MNNPKVSIIIPTYNCVQFLTEALESVLAQTFKDFEIIIVDDGSQDNTKEKIQPYLVKYPNKIKYFWQKNQGPAMARNTGILNSHGEYLALLDSDDKCLPCRLEESIRVLEADNSVGLVHGHITHIDVNNKEIGTSNRKIKYLNGYIFKNIFLRDAHISCPTVMFRRSCCEKVGMFDTSQILIGCEDRDLWLRISQEYKIIYIDKVLAYYRNTPESLSSKSKKMFEARLYIIDKYCPKDDPSKRNLRNKALARIFRELGDQYLLRSDYINARREYYKSIGYNPLAPWSWFNLMKTFNLTFEHGHVKAGGSTC